MKIKKDFTLANMRKWDLIKYIRELESENEIQAKKIEQLENKIIYDNVSYTKLRVLEEEVRRLKGE